MHVRTAKGPGSSVCGRWIIDKRGGRPPRRHRDLRFPFRNWTPRLDGLCVIHDRATSIPGSGRAWIEPPFTQRVCLSNHRSIQPNPQQTHTHASTIDVGRTSDTTTIPHHRQTRRAAMQGTAAAGAALPTRPGAAAATSVEQSDQRQRRRPRQRTVVGGTAGGSAAASIMVALVAVLVRPFAFHAVPDEGKATPSEPSTRSIPRPHRPRPPGGRAGPSSSSPTA